MNRRSAIASMLASCAAPYFVPVERLMRIKPIVVATDWPDPALVNPELYKMAMRLNQCGKSNMAMWEFTCELFGLPPPTYEPTLIRISAEPPPS